MQVKGIHHCSVLVADTRRSLVFSHGVLVLRQASTEGFRATLIHQYTAQSEENG